MKKIFTFCLSLLVGCIAAHAQISTPVDETFQFVDAEGNVIPNGTRVVRNIVADDGFIYADVLIANKSEAGAFHSLTGTVKSISGTAEAQCCYAPTGEIGTCFPLNNEGATFTTKTFLSPVGAAYDSQTECAVGENSSCELELQITKYDVEIGEAGVMAGDTPYPGSKITILFTTDPAAGIDGVTTTESNEIVARYTLDGQKLSAPQKGINIVKYADGRTAKVMVK